MNIEKSIEILKVFRNYNKFYKEENRDLTITIILEAKEKIDKAIERLLTAYEKEKETTDKLKKLNIPVDTLIAEFKRLEDLEDDREMLKAEFEKEKEKNSKAREFIKENSHEFNCKRDGLIELEFDYNTNATDLIDILDGNW